MGNPRVDQLAEFLDEMDLFDAIECDGLVNWSVESMIEKFETFITDCNEHDVSNEEREQGRTLFIEWVEKKRG